MNWPLLVFGIGFVLIFLLRLPIAIGMITVSTFYMIAAGLDISMVAEKVLSNLFAKYVIMAVPLFVFTANVMNTGKVTEMVFNFATGLVGRWKGSLAHVNIIDSLIFSGMTGSAVADASGLGIMEIEAMRKHGYEDSFSCALTAASATIGPIFPPSIPMVVYAMLSGASIGNLFLGGMVPGVLIAVALMVYVWYVAHKRDYPRGARYSAREFVGYTLRALPALLTPVILLGGIYSGVVTPTEAGALAGFYALIISTLVYRVMGPKTLWKVILDTARTTGTLSLIVGAAFTFSYVVAVEQIPELVAQLFLGLTDNKHVFLLMVNVIFLVLGMFIDTSTIQVVFVPIVLPTVQALGIDLVHFGVLIVFNMMIGLSTPPFGVLLFIVSGISGTKLEAIIKEMVPMLIMLTLVLFLVTYVPEIVMFVPNAFGR